MKRMFLIAAVVVGAMSCAQHDADSPGPAGNDPQSPVDTVRNNAPTTTNPTGGSGGNNMNNDGSNNNEAGNSLDTSMNRNRQNP